MQRYFKPIIFLLISGVLAFSFNKLLITEYFDYLIYDFAFTHSPYIDTHQEKVVVIGIDDQTLGSFPEPLVLWHNYLAEVIMAAANNNASGVGLDIIPSISLESIAKGMDRTLFKAMIIARSKGTPVILGYDIAKNGMKPHKKFIVASAGMAYLNFWPDHDRVIRKYKSKVSNKKKEVKSLATKLIEMSKLKNIDDVDTIYLDYRSKVGDVLSFQEVYKKSISGESDWLKSKLSGKIVLVGVTTPKLHDNHMVPVKLDGQKLIPGIFIHNIAINTLLSEIKFEKLSASIMLAVFISLVLISGGSFLYFAPMKASILLTLLTVTSVVFIFFSFRNNIICEPSQMACALLIPSIVCGMYRSIIEYQQFNMLQRYFKSYVSKNVLEEIIENPNSIGFSGKNVHATIMFADIRNFTTLSEHLKPEDVVHGLNQYFSRMTASISCQNGYLNRYLGDGLLAIFGAPNPLPYHGALASIVSALKMLDELNELNKSNLFPGIDQIKIGIGVHTGDAIVGNIGCYEKMDYSIIGDAVNLASRIEGMTKNYDKSVLISEYTYNLVQDKIEANFVAETFVKGREQAVKLFEVTAVKHQTRN